jgi:hypothetical protein
MEDGDSTKPPHESKRRPPKRRRKFTRSVRARPNASTADDIDAISDAAAARDPIVEPEHRDHGEQIQESLVANPIQAAVTSSAASRKLSNSELQAELKRKYKDLQDAHRTMASQSTTISSLSRRNKVLSEGTQKARASLREERDEMKWMESRAVKAERCVQLQQEEMDRRVAAAVGEATRDHDSSLEKAEVSSITGRFEAHFTDETSRRTTIATVVEVRKSPEIDPFQWAHPPLEHRHFLHPFLFLCAGATPKKCGS